MNNTYLYDGSFDSLIILISSLIDLHIIPKDIKTEDKYEFNLLEEPINLKQNIKSSTYKYIKNKLSKKIIHTIYYVYLSNDICKELVIFYFLKNVLKYKDEIYLHLNLKCVNRALKLSKQVSREGHRIKGFLRFKQMQNNFFYAEINPTNNVLCIVANHFKHRLKNECWIIKDINRNMYAIYNSNEILYLTDKEVLKLNIIIDKSDEECEELWKSFFNNIAIKERKNLRCQMNFMPKKYWKYIIEMENKYENGNS